MYIHSCINYLLIYIRQLFNSFYWEKIAKLSQDNEYMSQIISLNLLRSVLNLLFELLKKNSDSLILQDGCCIAICRIALKLMNVN